MNSKRNAYRFIKDHTGKWYIELNEWTGSRADLQMVQGADIMLDVVCKNTNEVTLVLSEEPFPGACTLKLVEVCPPNVGGGMYVLQEHNGEIINQKMWLCAVTVWLFKRLPALIYFKVSEPLL